MHHREYGRERPPGAVQSGNKAWWTANPMTYDWHRTIDVEPLTEPWFAEMDDRWIKASFPYVSTAAPFDRIMPDDMSGLRVLEIGCGMGLHTEQLAQRGALVTAVDLTEPAVEATATRMHLRRLPATVQQADAEALPFDDDSFDLVWSWGVIHHSSSTARIVREISRVLQPQGEARIMVYNRSARIARLSLLRHYVIGREYRTKSVDEVLWAHSDGFIARHYSLDGWNDLLRGFFQESTTEILGQEVDVVPLPPRLRKVVAALIPPPRKVASVSKHGWFLFSVARNPL